MKKLLLFAALVLGMVSCMKDNSFDANVGGEADVVLSVALPSDATRAKDNDSALGAIGNIDLAEYDIRYILEVFDANDTLAKRIEQFEAESTSTTFELRLIPGRAYTFVVWADFVQRNAADEVTLARYDVTSLREVSPIGAHKAMDESRDAYTGTFYVDDFSSSSVIDFKLKRPFAKLRVVTNDIDEIYSELQSAEIEYTVATYQQFDALKKTASEPSLVTKSVNYTKEAYLYAGEPTTDGEQTLFADYIFGTENGTVQFVMTVTDNVEEFDPISFNTAIPVQRNYLTTIKGAILTDPGKVTVEIKEAFENAGNLEDKPFYVEVVSGNKTETMELTEGTYLFDNITFNVENGPAILVKSGCNVVIDIMDSMTINADQGIVLEDGATLTINGLADTRSSNRAGRLVINASEGSAIGGNDITINNLASLVAVGNGDHAFGIGGTNAEVTINNTKVDYVAGGHIQPLFVNDTKYGKSEPEGGAAIGGTNVVIENSEIVKAEGGSKAAAIGNRFWNSTEVVIKNSQLGDIFGGNASAAIGGSRYNNESKHNIKILIENSTITNAVGGEAGAGIGSGYDTHCNQQNYTAVNNIIIKESTITAKGGKYSPGIGAGYHSAYLTGSIDAESTINSTAGDLTFYKETYTVAQNLGYGVMDPAREFSGENTNVTFTVAGKVIAAPALKVAEGVSKDLAGNYYISNAEGLAWVSENVNTMEFYVSGSANIFDNVTVYLANDIDLGGAEWRPIGDYAFSRTSFNGVFDGQGYTVSNFKVTEPVRWTEKVAEASYGFFGNVKGTIKNLTIQNATVNPEGGRYSAALVGRLHNGGCIENCHVKNSSVTILHWQVGGIVGQNNNGNISDCSVVDSTITGMAAVGAIIGMDMKAGEHTIENCRVANTALVQNESFGASYDASYGLAVGLVNVSGIVLNINDIVAENNTIKGVADNTLVGDKEEGAVIKLNGATAVSTAAELDTAIKAGGNYVLANDIAMTEAIYQNVDVTIDGNGHTISQAEGTTNEYALFDSVTGKITLKNVKFAGIKGGAVLRTIGAEATLDNVTVEGAETTQKQGLLRLLGKSTIKNSTFKNNSCSMVITLNYDGANNDPQVVENCVFEGNTCNGTAVLYYVKGEKATINGNKFIGNTVNCETNGATIYMGFTENNVVTNNLFQNNTVNEAGESSRVAGGVFFGYETVFTGNAFISNKVTGKNAKGNDVCVSTYYTSIDLSGNYWGGNAPVEDTNYFVQHKSDERVVTINDYLTTNPIK